MRSFYVCRKRGSAESWRGSGVKVDARGLMRFCEIKSGCWTIFTKVCESRDKESESRRKSENFC